MKDAEIVNFLSKEWGRTVTLADAEEINRDLTALAHIMIEGYFEFKKKGLIDETGKLLEKKRGECI